MADCDENNTESPRRPRKSGLDRVKQIGLGPALVLFTLAPLAIKKVVDVQRNKIDQQISNQQYGELIIQPLEDRKLAKVDMYPNRFELKYEDSWGKFHRELDTSQGNFERTNDHVYAGVSVPHAGVEVRIHGQIAAPVLTIDSPTIKKPGETPTHVYLDPEVFDTPELTINLSGVTETEQQRLTTGLPRRSNETLDMVVHSDIFDLKDIRDNIADQVDAMMSASIPPIMNWQQLLSSPVVSTYARVSTPNNTKCTLQIVPGVIFESKGEVLDTMEVYEQEFLRAMKDRANIPHRQAEEIRNAEKPIDALLHRVHISGVQQNSWTDRQEIQIRVDDIYPKEFRVRSLSVENDELTIQFGDLEPVTLPLNPLNQNLTSIAFTGFLPGATFNLDGSHTYDICTHTTNPVVSLNPRDWTSPLKVNMSNLPAHHDDGALITVSDLTGLAPLAVSLPENLDPKTVEDTVQSAAASGWLSLNLPDRSGKPLLNVPINTTVQTPDAKWNFGTMIGAAQGAIDSRPEWQKKLDGEVETSPNRVR